MMSRNSSEVEETLEECLGVEDANQAAERLLARGRILKALDDLSRVDFLRAHGNVNPARIGMEGPGWQKPTHR